MSKHGFIHLPSEIYKCVGSGGEARDNDEQKVRNRMSSNNFVCLLTQGSGSKPEFLVSEVNLRPGQEFQPDSQGTVLLAGGFSSISPDTGFPLSPTLKVNKDLGSCSEDLLQRLANAEMARIQAMNYKSYTVEPDPRLCVIGNAPRQMNNFLDTYSGILDIVPVLVSGFDPEIETANELSVSKGNDGYFLEYSVRVPVDKSKCTYCGACGQVCPETCLDEQLFVDFSKCTFCKECEKACAAEAIDIYGAEQRHLRIPAIVVLAETELELPDDTSGIYSEKGISDFISTQFAFQVDEVVTCDSSICQYSGKLGYGCSMCFETCQHGAITRTSSGIRIDAIKCEECGGCIAVCPTGAMQFGRFNDRSLIDYIQALEIAPGTTVVLGSEKGLHRLWWKRNTERFQDVIFIEYPEIKSISLFHLLFLYTSGAGRVILTGTESELEEMEPLGQQVALASSLLATYCQVSAVIEVTPVEMVTTANATPLPYPLKETLRPLTGTNRRENLAEILLFLTEATGRQARIKANAMVPFATISCDNDSCTNCYACLNSCRIQALGAREDELALLSKSSLCVGCGSCVRVCPERALGMVSGATLDEEFFKQQTLAEAEPMHCKKCGKVFGSRQTYERVMSILASRESVDTSHFEYCENCRVAKIFEDA